MMTFGPTAKRTGLLVGIATVLALGVTAIVLPTVVPSLSLLGPKIATLVGVKLFFSTLTVLLLAMLFGNYVQMYRRMPNPFTRSLLVFTMLLGFYAVTANPLLPLVLGAEVPAMGLFTYLPDIFTAVAVVTLLHQSLK